MADEVTITNQALGFLGVDRITSLNDNVKAAKLAKEIYPDIRDLCLEGGDWTFATKFYKLVPDSTGPIYGEGKYFTVPNEVIRVIRVNGNSYPWALEGNKIRISLDEAKVEAIARLTDVDKMSPMFRQALAARMSMDMALPLTQSKTMLASMAELFAAKMEEAKANDGMQGTSRKFSKGRLVVARQNGSDLGGRSNVFGPYV